MAFLINEERALKAKVQGLTVTDLRNNARPVKVWFGMPDVEITEAAYPFITINLIGISEAFERAHRGVTVLGYDPEGYTRVDGSTSLVDYPIPYNLDYQVTTWTRFPMHDRELVGKLLAYDRLPHRFGALEVPEDDTVRRLDLLSVNVADTMDANNKRLFRKVFVIRISSELLPSEIRAVKNVLTVSGTLINAEGYTAEQILNDPTLVADSSLETITITGDTA